MNQLHRQRALDSLRAVVRAELAAEHLYPHEAAELTEVIDRLSRESPGTQDSRRVHGFVR